MINQELVHYFEGRDTSSFESYLEVAYLLGSSDVHFEPLPQEMRVRCRVEGQLLEIARLPHPPGPKKPHPIILQIKAASGMQQMARAPEDGRVGLEVGGKPLSVRLSSIPQVFGEKVVARIFDVNRIRDLRSLGFRTVNLERLKEIVSRKSGMVLVCGPTGSGKTTTLYSVLNYLNQDNRNVVTVEDPVEYFFTGMNQIQVEPGRLNFDTAMRSILRQDPDIIMVGEIRDKETAEMAFHAAMTGHLVLTTVHSRDSVGALMRLLDLQLPPVVLAQAINGILAQRLMPRLCSECSVATIHPPLEAVPTYAPVGCARCKGGFQGRTGIQEVLVLTDSMRKMISLDMDEEEFRLVALREGMETLKEDAIFKSIEGSVSYRDSLGVTDESLHRIMADIRRMVAQLS